MKRILTTLFLSCCLGGYAAQGTGIDIIPKPIQLTQETGAFTLTPQTVISYAPGLQPQAAYLQEVLSASTGWNLKLEEGEKYNGNSIRLSLETEGIMPEGYESDFCPNYSSDPYLNAIYCSDMQLGEFIEWIQEQDFYENTTIVLTGDHQTMDNVWITEYVPEDFNRTVYNAFINSAVEPVNEKNRLFSSYDMYPTILASMGATIEGDQLGLGTNLFSSQETLIEQLGYLELSAELEKNSKFYNREFIYSN